MNPEYIPSNMLGLRKQCYTGRSSSSTLELFGSLTVWPIPEINQNWSVDWPTYLHRWHRWHKQNHQIFTKPKTNPTPPHLVRPRGSPDFSKVKSAKAVGVVLGVLVDSRLWKLENLQFLPGTNKRLKMRYSWKPHASPWIFHPENTSSHPKAKIIFQLLSWKDLITVKCKHTGRAPWYEDPTRPIAGVDLAAKGCRVGGSIGRLRLITWFSW